MHSFLSGTLFTLFLLLQTKYSFADNVPLRCLTLISTQERFNSMRVIMDNAQTRLNQALGESANTYKVVFDTEFYNSKEHKKSTQPLSADELNAIQMQTDSAVDFLVAYHKATQGSDLSLFPVRNIAFRSDKGMSYKPEDGTLVVGFEKSGLFTKKLKPLSGEEIRKGYMKGQMLDDSVLPGGALKRKKMKIVWQLVNPMSPLRIAVKNKVLPRLKEFAGSEKLRDIAKSSNMDIRTLRRALSKFDSDPSLISRVEEFLIAQASLDKKNEIQHRSNNSDVRQFGVVNVSSIDNVSVLDGVMDTLGHAAGKTLEDRSKTAQNNNPIQQIGIVNVSTIDNIQVYTDLLGGINGLTDSDFARALVHAAATP